MADAKEVRYGHVEGPGKGREYEVGAADYYHRRGGKFVHLEAGKLDMAASGDTIVGWAETSKHDTGKDAWLSADGDYLFVIYGLEDVFEIPADESNASMAASWIGKHCNITVSGATYSSVQKGKFGSAASPLSIVDVDTDNKTLKVKINPKMKQ